MRIKKLVVTVFALILMLGILPMAANASEIEPEIIDTVEINDIDFPKEGEAPDYNVSIPEGSGYHVEHITPNYWSEQNGVSWHENISDVEATVLQPGNAAFKAGKVYSVLVTIAADEGYEFCVNDEGMYLVNAYVNGIPATVSISFKNNQKNLCVSMKFAVLKKYDLIVDGGEAYIDKSNMPTESQWEPVDSAPAGSYIRIEAYEKEGWEFDHWEVLEGTIDNLIHRYKSFFTMPERDIRLRAYYKELDGDKITCFHSVILCFGDDPIAGYSVADGDLAVEPEAPYQEGKRFLGWYTKDGKKYDFSTPVTEDVTLTAKFKLCSKHSWNAGKVITQATVTKDGSKKVACKICGVTDTKKIYKASGVVLSYNSCVYNGKTRSPKVYVKDSKGNTIDSNNYTITSPKGKKNVGQYTYTIKFKNQYLGTKNLTLKINPKGTTVAGLTKARKAFTVKWNKQSSKMSTLRITGYQIQYSTSKKFTNPKIKTVSGYGNTSKKITGLKAKTTYYVRVRTYKTIKVSGKSVNLYSGWSGYKYVKTK